MKNYMDFMMVLSPTDAVKAQIREHKQYAAQIIGNYESMNSIAHISIKNLSCQKIFLTEPAILNLKQKLAIMPPVTLTIDSFDYFNHGEGFKTIYARLRSAPSTSLWFKELKRHLHVKAFLVPHITITRNIPIEQFNQLWPYFSNLKWDESFTITALTVLQRETFASFANWELFSELPFEGKALYNLSPPRPSLVSPVKQNPFQGKQISLF